MYSQDFATADAVFEPVPEGLVLGLPPLLLLLLLILLLAAGSLGWWVGRRPRRDSDSAATAIWKAVDEAIRAAMTAHSDVLADKARGLRRIIQDRLGKTLALTAGFHPLAALDHALGDVHPAVDDHGKGHGPEPKPTPDDPHDGNPDVQTPGVLIEKASRVVIHPPATSRDRSPAPPAPPPTEAQRRDAIRKAISDLNDHWRLKEARIADIEAAHRELSAG